MTSSDSDTDSSETASDSLIIGILDDIREHVQLADLPEDLLAAIVAFADLKTLGAGVATCRALRAASERLWALQRGFGTSFNLGREGHLDEQIELPWFHVFWNFPLGESAYREDREWQVGHPSTIDVRFLIGTAGGDVRDMSLSSARVVMEHFVAWSD